MGYSGGGGKKLVWWQLAFITFVFTSAGPFGMESCVRSAGPLLTFVLIFAVPVFHVLPMILIVTEMSSWMPTNHGSILWIARAYGPVVGFISGIMQMFISIVDLSVYPVLLVNYLAEGFFPDISFAGRYFLQLFFVIIGSVPAFFHIDSMGKVSGVILGLICVPFAVGVLAGLPRLDTRNWGDVRPSLDIATSWATGIWMYTGFMALGALGAEVEHHSVFLVGCTAAAVLDTIMYLLPLMVALQVPGRWEDGFLVKAFDKTLPGLGPFVSLAGALSGFGLYTSSVACFSRSIWGIADRGWIPKIFSRVSKTGSPYCACLLLVATSSVLVLFDFDFLVALLLVISACNFCLFYTGFVLLRYREPDAYRPFRCPGGIAGAWLIISPIVVVYFLLFVATVAQNFVIDLMLLAMLIVLVLLYVFVLPKNHHVLAVFPDVQDPRQAMAAKKMKEKNEAEDVVEECSGPEGRIVADVLLSSLRERCDVMALDMMMEDGRCSAVNDDLSHPPQTPAHDEVS